MGRTEEDYKDRLLNVLAPHSKGDGEDMLKEWKFATYTKSKTKQTCACGQSNCLNVATIFNPNTKCVYYPIGSTCINKFLSAEEADKHNVVKKKHDKEEKAQKKKQKMEEEKKQEIQEEKQQVGSYACTVHGCPHQTNDARHRYCTEHHKICCTRCLWECPFSKHKGKTWRWVVMKDKKYLTWILCKSGLFDTSPTNKYYATNRITRAYLENEYRHFSTA